MYYKYLVFISCIALSCTSKQVVVNETSGGMKPLSATKSSLLKGDTSLQKASLPLPHQLHHKHDSSLVSNAALNENSSALSADSVYADSTSGDKEFIDQRLEQARIQYLAALRAQEVEDTSNSEIDFENSIQILNELSDFPDIDTNQEFIDLSNSIVEDYEKYIAAIDTLSPYASLYALREKLNQVVDETDTSKIVVPTPEIHGTQVPLPSNEYVERAEKFFMERGRHYMDRWLFLSGRYVPMMKRIFREEGTPEELVYLSMTESGLRTDARSWARAVGLWQFMKGTGSLYGLRSNWWYDERRDFEKSTRAAARHLKELYSELNDWNLVLASYNAGAGRVFRAMRRSGSSDFWEMRRYLPRQTRNYIPQYIAVARMALNPKSYGFIDTLKADSMAYDVVEVNDCIDLRALAKCAGTTLDTIQDLNPELLRWCTPPGVSGYRFRIPAGRKDIFHAQYTSIPKEEKKDWVIHTVKRKETLSSIARQYSMSASLIKEVNNISSNRRLKIGTALAIPIPKDIADEKMPFDYTPQVRGLNLSAAKVIERTKQSGSHHKAVSSRDELEQPKGRERVVYHVKHGDTMGHIAEWYGVRASDIRNWNDISYGSYIRPGQALELWIPNSKIPAMKKIDKLAFSEKQKIVRSESEEGNSPIAGSGHVKAASPDWIQHKVKSGESLDKIARIYEVSIADLKRWNNLRTSRIKAGQTIEIYDKPEEKGKVIASSSKLVPANNSVVVKTSSKGLFAPMHKVKKGETISFIAQHYGVDINKLKRANGLRSNKIKAGQMLKIPGKSDS